MSRRDRRAGRRRPLGAALAALGAGVVTAACGTSAPTTVTGAAPAVATPPAIALATAVPSSAGTWVLLPMGILSDRENTFWQALVLPAAGGRWALRTPPGVADNGGLVVSSGTAPVAVGFRPSNRLSFSPVAVTADGGRSYSQGLLPSGLADIPGSLAAEPSGTLVALDGASVLLSSSRGASWRAVATGRALDGLAGLRSCGPGAPSAVAAPSSAIFVTLGCRAAGRVGVVEVDPGATGAHLRVVGPDLAARAGGAQVEVLRATPDRRGVALLLALRQAGVTRYVGAWDPAGGTAWTLSSAYAPAGALVSASATSGGGFAVLTAPSAGGRQAAVLTAPASAGASVGSVGGSAAGRTAVASAGSWRSLPAPPAGVAVLAVTGSRTDAIAGGRAAFVDWVLTSRRWMRRQVTDVTIPYGSSS